MTDQAQSQANRYQEVALGFPQSTRELAAQVSLLADQLEKARSNLEAQLSGESLTMRMMVGPISTRKVCAASMTMTKPNPSGF
jgi:hypothetical protein